MKIKKIHIENFKSIENETFIFEENMASIIGSNNVGKSNLLECIKRCLSNKWMSSNSFSVNDIFKRDTEREILIRIIFDKPIEYKKYKESPSTPIFGFLFNYKKYKIGEEKGKYHLEQRCLDKNEKEISTIIKKYESGKGPIFEALANIPQEIKDYVNIIYMGIPRTIESQLPSSQYSFLRIMFNEICNKIKSEQELLDKYNNLIEEILSLLKTNDFKKIEESIKKNTLEQFGIQNSSEVDILFSSFDPFIFFSNLQLIINENGFECNATELGEGMQNAIVLSIMKTYGELKKQDSIILIEEPEMFLHPQKQKFLYSILEKISEKNQIIFTTHSVHFVALPNFKRILRLDKIDGATKLLNNFNIREKNILDTNKKDNIKILKDFESDIKEFFFAKKVIFGEGPTERLSIPIYAKRLNLDFDADDISIIDVKGKNNLKKFVMIAKYLSISTVCIYDTDSKEYEGKRDKEVKYNQELEDLGDNNTLIIKMEKDYETELKNTITEEEFNKNEYEGSKPIKARLIAENKDLKIPEKIIEIINWIKNN